MNNLELTLEQKDQLNRISSPEEKKCLMDFWTSTHLTGINCNSTFDSIYCWPTSSSNTLVSIPCSDIISKLPTHLSTIQANAYRMCDSNGQWLWGNWSNYTECLDLLDLATAMTDETRLSVSVIAYISFFGSLISFVLLAITLIIFIHFKSLQCSRVSVHRQLVLALLIRFALMIVIAEPLVTQRTHATYQQLDWLCKTVLCLQLWSTMCSINWMFLEGLYLHGRITVSIFDDRAPFLLFCAVGWGLPMLFVGIWAWVMAINHPKHCWRKYGELHYTWILAAPITVALTINLIFLINILRILVTRLKAQQQIESEQLKKTIKATVVLFPLLGIPNLIFFLNPGDGDVLENAYMISNAILQSSQGISVSILYCFLDKEVRNAVRKKYIRRLTRKNPDSKRLAQFKSFRTTSTVTQFECTNVAFGESSKENRSFRLKKPSIKVRTSSLLDKSTPPTANSCV